MDSDWMFAHFYLGENKWSLPEYFHEMTNVSMQDDIDSEMLERFKTQSNKVLVIPDELDFTVNEWGGIKYMSSDLKTDLKIKLGSNGYGYVAWRVNHEQKTALIHRVLGFCFMGAPPTSDHTIDHANNNPMDNSRANLSWATTSQQMRNRKPYKRRKQVNIVFTDSPEYIPVKKVPYCGQIFDFEQTSFTRSMHLALDGTHFIVNGKTKIETPTTKKKKCHTYKFKIQGEGKSIALHQLLYLNVHDHIPDLTFIDNNYNNWGILNLKPATRSERTLISRYEKHSYTDKSNSHKRVRLTRDTESYEFDGLRNAALWIQTLPEFEDKKLPSICSFIGSTARGLNNSVYGFKAEYIE